MRTWQKLRHNPKLWERYDIRELVLTAIRTFFREQGFHEVEVPLLTGFLPPESYLDIFETTILDRNRKPGRAFLATSPEPFIKKLLVAGRGNCFTLTKSFRNTEGQSKTHNPEFTILEWYRVAADYTGIMKDCEELLLFINTYLVRSKPGRTGTATKKLVYQGKSVDLSSPWERISIVEAFKKYAGLDLDRMPDAASMVEAARKKGYRVGAKDTWDDLFYQIYLNEIEHHLGRGKPTIIYDYPASLAALSKKKKDNPAYAERFEFYIEGLELGDAYTELTDWKEQVARFESEVAEQKRLGKLVHPVDTDFIDALKAGMPEAGGIAVGVDRLIMLFADATNIADTLLFPGSELFERYHG